MKRLVIRRGYQRTTRQTAKSAECIQKFWRLWARLRPKNNTTASATPFYVRCGGKDIICPITQDIVEIHHCFKFITASGHVQAYDAVALLHYLKSSNNFSCPCTRQDFTRTEILRLRNTLKKVSDPMIHNEIQTLISDFEMRWRLRRTNIEQSYRVLAIENTCGLIMTECLDVCSNLSITTQEASVQLLNYLLPEWRQVVEDFMRLSLTDCKAMLIADREKIIRLELTDIHDPHGLLYLIRETISAKLQVAIQRQEHAAPVRLFEHTIMSILNTLPVVHTDRQWLFGSGNFNNRFGSSTILGRNTEAGNGVPSFFSYNSQT